MTAPIVLLTDFGRQDSYAACLKGVILSIHPHAHIVDLSHEIPPQNVIQAAVLLSQSYDFFPKGSIFVCVVDPGVGTCRKILCVRTSHYYFIGPDNGLLDPVVRHRAKVSIRSIENRRYFLKRAVSQTFHGRDIMAPVAAYLARRSSIFCRLGPVVRSVRRLDFPRIQKDRRSIRGEILFFDGFGNGITNICRADMSERFWMNAKVYVGRRAVGKLVSTYGRTSRRLVPLFNSSNRLEIARPCGSAKIAGKLIIGSPVKVLQLVA
ncbi:MAG: SAM-dependent chlorinase/fluorinase [Candidatus Omnitrophica bacterium]|nr:SAM-dependent chlorinase/fluorinase [Candidatus Omnitrophota bacterium]